MRSKCLLLVASLTSVLACGSRSSDVRPERRAAPEIRWPASQVELGRVLARPVGTVTTMAAPPLTEEADPSQPGEPLPEGVPGVQAREHRIAGLYVLEVVLGHVDIDAALPLVVMLHGRGDRPRVPGGPFGGTSMPMRLLLPRAPKPLGNGFTWLPVSVTEGRHDVLAATLQERAAQLRQVILRFREMRPTLGEPIVTGFSQGAMLTFALTILHPDVVKVSMPIAGWLPPQLLPLRPPPPQRRPRIRSIHGSADPVVRIQPTRQLIRSLRALGYEIDWVEEPGVAHVVSEAMNRRFERWLQTALEQEAPELRDAGVGLVAPGEEVAKYVPWEALDDETIRAIQEEEAEAAAAAEAAEQAERERAARARAAAAADAEESATDEAADGDDEASEEAREPEGPAEGEEPTSELTPLIDAPPADQQVDEPGED